MKKDKATVFTNQQFADWKAFKRVLSGGRWNMFDPNARRATKLSEERYRFAMWNYSEIKEAIEKGQP